MSALTETTAGVLSALFGGSPAKPGPQMQAVLDRLEALGARPAGTVDAAAFRAQPGPADAVASLLAEGVGTPPSDKGLQIRDFSVPGAAGEIAARAYLPQGPGPLPVIVYFHGGGWVLGGLDAYDATARALALGAEALVLAFDHRCAPEHPFPAAHLDAVAAWQWASENAAEFGGDPLRMAVAGESAGGNLAIGVALAARDRGMTPPLHQLLVYPVAGNDLDTASYRSHAEAAPLGRQGMEWFIAQAFPIDGQTEDPRLNVVARDDLAGLPPATILNARIDPLLSEGETLAARLIEAGVPVTQRTFDGVTHEFFGMGAVVETAQEAMDLATGRLRHAFHSGAPGAMATLL
ncbi:alpha/beta hydrolase [Frigidibacter sp.]|uniref:alpha/beta hydrolase n=1 Tax=Frigidibacter sp. TaxID=2586418 RepID=UPI00273771B9|nr:alpha/beta hydrolase [Frigidibacter sp.]MDP3339991.1 alpha/beta hydrolase [Frigidibacter sp.]